MDRTALSIEADTRWMCGDRFERKILIDRGEGKEYFIYNLVYSELNSMPTKLVILGLLRDRDLHGYEIKHIIEDHMGDWTNIAFGSIYFALGKLTEEGFIRKAGVEKPTGRPARSVYTITERGRDEFSRLLKELWSTQRQQYFDLDIALFFVKALPREETEGYLSGRIHDTEKIIDHVTGHKKEQIANPYVPPIAEALFDHSLHHLNAELTWLKEVLRKFESGEWI